MTRRAEKIGISHNYLGKNSRTYQANVICLFVSKSGDETVK